MFWDKFEAIVKILDVAGYGIHPYAEPKEHPNKIKRKESPFAHQIVQASAS